MIVSNETTSTALNERLALYKVAQELTKEPLAVRLEGIRKLLFKLHPDFVYPDSQHCAAVAEIRNANVFNEFSKSEEGSMRHLFKIPEYVWHALKADQEFTKLQGSNDKNDIVKLHKALWAAFPMYRTARKY